MVLFDSILSHGTESSVWNEPRSPVLALHGSGGALLRGGVLGNAHFLLVKQPRNDFPLAEPWNYTRSEPHEHTRPSLRRGTPTPTRSAHICHTCPGRQRLSLWWCRGSTRCTPSAGPSTPRSTRCSSISAWRRTPWPCSPTLELCRRMRCHRRETTQRLAAAAASHRGHGRRRGGGATSAGASSRSRRATTRRAAAASLNLTTGMRVLYTLVTGVNLQCACHTARVGHSEVCEKGQPMTNSVKPRPPPWPFVTSASCPSCALAFEMFRFAQVSVDEQRGGDHEPQAILPILLLHAPHDDPQRRPHWRLVN